MRYFEYGEKEINYLKSKDKLLGQAIDRIGFVKRKVIPDLFAGLIYNIVGQQISMKAADTIWNRIEKRFGAVTPGVIRTVTVEELQSTGVSMRKAEYIKKIADAILDGSFSIEELWHLEDEEVRKRLTSLPGVGQWTAEMLMIFSMQRKNILSWNDLGIRRGIMLLYNHTKLDKELFEKYRLRYSPYGTIASFYLWEISLGR
ncbi:MAG: DNA-3-methyladenine glycosylase [Tepidanaerobacteraceae bacterium]|nr:DNA-3-methyladenine glycosylase [Tepidanaerobacteraceae bacterium]